MLDIDSLSDELADLKKAGLYCSPRTIQSGQGPWLIVDGVRVLNLCSNNYLGLANNRKLKTSVKKVVEEFGIGTGGARLISGNNTLHRELEQKLASFKKAEDAIIFASGWDANIGTIQAITGKDDVIFADELNHGSLIDSCRLSRARTLIFPHKDMSALRSALGENRMARRKLILTDGVFSMDGDLAPLPQIVDLAEEYGATTMVDDAHGDGVLGVNGAGIVEHFGLHGKIDIEMGTMSKAFGVIGGYITGHNILVDYLRQKARTSLLATTPTLIDIAAGIAAIETLGESNVLLEQLWENTKYFKENMRVLGYDTGISETPIIPIILGDETLCQSFAKALFHENIFATSICFPTVPKGKARIRVMISAAHTENDLNFAVSAFDRIRDKLNSIKPDTR